MPHQAILEDADVAFHQREYERLRVELQAAHDASQLPESPSDESRKALNDLLLEVADGTSSTVVARCRIILISANENVDALGNYGITAAKLTKLPGAIAAFDSIKTAPRQNRVTQSVAAQLVQQMIRAVVGIVRDQLDGLMLQFKEVNPNFYEEYSAARVMVDL